MESTSLRNLLESVRRGETGIEDAMTRLRHLPFEDLGCATVDHHRELRQGFPEVVFGGAKTVAQVEKIVASLLSQGNNVLVTRLDQEKGLLLREHFPAGRYDAEARCLWVEQKPVEVR